MDERKLSPFLSSYTTHIIGRIHNTGIIMRSLQYTISRCAKNSKIRGHGR